LWHSGNLIFAFLLNQVTLTTGANWRQQVEVSRIVAEIDAQILKLQQARALLSGASAPAVRTGRGRPKGSKNGGAAAAAPAGTRKRKLSPEGRKRIAEAMKKRWAERRKQNAKG
jgi:hypothetical protein